MTGLSKICLFEIDLIGAEKFKKAGIETNVIFIVPPSLEELKKRLEHRATETPEVIQRRLDIAKGEIEKAKSLDFISETIVNDDFEVFYQRMLDTIKKMYSHFLY